MNNPTHPWATDPEQLASQLATDLEQGLTEAEAKKRLKQTGENIFSDDGARSPLQIFLQQFNNPLILALLLAAGVTLFLGEWVDTAVIVLAVFINTALGFTQEYRAERAITDLQSYVSHRTRVQRAGREFEIDARLLVPGDIIHLSQGARVTADARIIKEIDLSIDEALLTGESHPENKNPAVLSETTLLADRDNMVFAGTLVVGGSGYALVTHTGDQTEIGKIANLVSSTTAEKTPLQKALGQLTWIIIAVISIIVIIVFAIGIYQNQPFYEMLLISIAIIVGSIPEALPVGLTAVLAVGVEQIAKKKGIMRSLTAAETLGSTTIIMTDKTGTLTQAKMQLVDIATTTDLLTKPLFDGARERYSAEQKELLALALSGTDVVIEDDKLDPKDWVMSGSILEKNIVQSAALRGIKFNQAEKSGIQTIIPFSSKYKFSVNKIPNRLLPDSQKRQTNPHIVLGAPDILLKRSTMDNEHYQTIRQMIARLSQSGKRVLGVALLSPQTASGQDLTPDAVGELVFLGVICFYDPIRPEVIDALREINSYGVKVVMATGDLPGTAFSVAKELGWAVDEKSILTGDQIRQLTDDELRTTLDYVTIFARVTPEDKLRITKLYQSRGEIVAMTGDGVNDAPSLKAANIGIAVGSGSDVAKGTADLVLLDDNFKTIVATIEEGKRMLINIKKIFVYLMSNSLDEAILIGGAILAGLTLPLSALQIIWVNLFTGSIPAIAYAFDRQAVSKSKPSTSLFDPTVKFLTIGIGTLSSVLLLALYIFLAQTDLPLETVKNVIFACFSSYILVIAFSFRNLHLPIYRYSLTENKVLLFGVGFGFLLLFATLYLPLFQNIFGTESLSLGWLMFVVAWLVLNVVIVEMAKWFARVYLAK